MRQGRIYGPGFPPGYLSCAMGMNRLRHIELWWILAPQKRQRIMVPNHEKTTCWQLSPQYFCTYHLSFNAFRLLCDSINNRYMETKEHLIDRLNQTMSRKTIAPSRAEKLPPELLEIVFSFLDPEDFVAPGPRSQSLWTQAITWAQNGYRRWRAEYSWAGTPIICTGTHLSSLPQPMYDMFPEATPSPPPQGLISRQRISRANRNEASEWNHNVTNSYNKNPIPYDESYRENFGKIVSLAGIPERLHEAMSACLPTLDIEHESKWYLRNLTQKEYIRMEIAKTTTGEITVVLLGKNWLTLDILLMWLISWSQKDYETGFTWEELEQGDVYNDIQDADLMDTNSRERRIGQVFKSMKAGKWAAHALDVVDVETGEGWFDRTDTIERLSKNWLRALYGQSLEDNGDEEVKKYWAKLYEDSKRSV